MSISTAIPEASSTGTPSLIRRPGPTGNLGRDAVHGPGRLNFDTALSRSFRFQERYRVEARFEAFNVINHVNYNNPATSIASSTFGKITGAADPRILQVSAKFHF